MSVPNLETIRGWREPLEKERTDKAACALHELEEWIANNEPCRLKVILLTPILGGGFHVANENEEGKAELLVDFNTPVRPSEIRGHLRFWWRMLKPGVKKPAELLAEEEAIFGGPAAEGGKAKGPNLTLSVDIPWSLYADKQAGQPKKADARKAMLVKQARNLVPSFVAWPFADKLATFALKGILARNALSMNISFRKGLNAEQAKEFGEALRLWLWLGGVGARVRRGAGAVMPSPFWEEKDWKWLEKKAKEIGSHAKANPPHLEEVRIVPAFSSNGTYSDMLTYENIFLAWNWAAETYKELLAEEFPSKGRNEELRAVLGAPFPWAKKVRDTRLASPIIFRPTIIDGEVYILAARLKNLVSETSCKISANDSFVHEFYEKFVNRLKNSRPEKPQTEGPNKKRKKRRK